MLKAIMAVDDNGGVSKLGSMPWPKNSDDLQWFKKNTLNQVVIMGRLTWVDPMVPTPLPNRINILITNKSPQLFPGAQHCISGNLNEKINKIINEYKALQKWVIGGPNIVDQLFDFIDTFYLTRIYGRFNCDKKLDINKIQQNMKLDQKIKNNDTCHFEVWKR